MDKVEIDKNKIISLGASLLSLFLFLSSRRYLQNERRREKYIIR